MTGRVLVTGTGGTGVGASVLRALAGTRWTTVAADAHPFSWGLYTASEGVLVPWADDPGYVAHIAALTGAHDIDVVIPGTEAETVLLAGALRVPVIANVPALMPLMTDKTLAAAALAALGLPSIPSYPYERHQEAAAEFGFPVVVKPARNSSGSRGVHLVTSVAELAGLASVVTPGSIVQPYTGDSGSEYTVGVVSDRAGAVIGSIAMRRQLTGLSLLAARGAAAVSTGFSQGFIEDAPDVREFCEDLAVRLGSRGPLNIQLRRDGGSFAVFEIHPRFSFSTAIRASAGFNEPDMLLRHWLLGEQVKCPVYETGVAAIRSFDHILVRGLL